MNRGMLRDAIERICPKTMEKKVSARMGSKKQDHMISAFVLFLTVLSTSAFNRNTVIKY